MKKLMLCVALFMAGCSKRPPQRFIAVGYVRFMWCQGRLCSMVFEGENGAIFTVRMLEVPPVWIGLHAEIIYELDPDYESGDMYKNIMVLKRLP